MFKIIGTPGATYLQLSDFIRTFYTNLNRDGEVNRKGQSFFMTNEQVASEEEIEKNREK